MFLLAAALIAQTQVNARSGPTSPAPVSAVRAVRAPVVDGWLNDSVWAAAPVIAGFIQTDPDEGRPASEATEVRLV